jgi:hypothetical protein
MDESFKKLPPEDWVSEKTLARELRLTPEVINHEIGWQIEKILEESNGEGIEWINNQERYWSPEAAEKVKAGIIVRVQAISATVNKKH